MQSLVIRVGVAEQDVGRRRRSNVATGHIAGGGMSNAQWVDHDEPRGIAAVERYRPMGTLGTATVVVFALGAIADITLAAVSAALLSQMGTAAATTWDGLISLLWSVTVVRVVILLVGIVLFLWWFRRGYGNAERLGHQRSYRIGWSLGAWFVPILNLFRPKRIADELWEAGNPDGSQSSSLVTWWWALFLLSSWVDRMVGRLPVDTPEQLVTSLRADIASYVLTVVATAVAILFVRRITTRLDSEAARLSANYTVSPQT